MSLILFWCFYLHGCYLFIYKMDWPILRFLHKKHVTNKDLRQRTSVMDFIDRLNTLKCNWAGYVSRNQANWRKHRLLEWTPRTKKRVGLKILGETQRTGCNSLRISYKRKSWERHKFSSGLKCYQNRSCITVEIHLHSIFVLPSSIVW